jgi:uncharacterized OB-fold protein
VTDISGLPTKVLEPPVSEAAEGFWDATRRRELALPWCPACARFFWYPREVCPVCLGEAVEWRPAAGTGEVYAVSVHHKTGPGRDPEDGPYAVALVDLPEGVRIMSNVVGVAPESVAVGTPVTVAWLPLSDGRHLPQFVPAEPGS